MKRVRSNHDKKQTDNGQIRFFIGFLSVRKAFINDELSEINFAKILPTMKFRSPKIKYNKKSNNQLP